MNPTHPPSLRVAIERWPIAGAFTISRGSKTEAEVVVAEISDGLARGRGECVPYRRYGETVESVTAAMRSMEAEVAGGLDRDRLAPLPSPGAARNALDRALWDLAARPTAPP